MPVTCLPQACCGPWPDWPQGWPPLVLAELRLLGGGALIFLYCGPERCLRLLRAAAPASLVAAAAGMALFQWSLFEAYARCGLAFTALVSTSASPLFADLFDGAGASWHDSRWRAASLLCAGTLCLAILLGSATASGVFLATLSAAGYAVYAAASKRVLAATPRTGDDASLPATAVALAAAGIALLPVAGTALASFSLGPHLGLAAFLAAVATALPYVLFVKGLRGLGPGNALVLLNIQPAAALLLALCAGQRVAPAHTICFILMALAMLLRSRASAVQLPT